MDQQLAVALSLIIIGVAITIFFIVKYIRAHIEEKQYEEKLYPEPYTGPQHIQGVPQGISGYSGVGYAGFSGVTGFSGVFTTGTSTTTYTGGITGKSEFFQEPEEEKLPPPKLFSRYDLLIKKGTAHAHQR